MLLIKNGNVHIGNGDILKGYDLLFKDGLIYKVDINIEENSVESINAKGMEIFPGFIDPVSFIGSLDIISKNHDHNEISSPITPEINIKHSFNHREIMLEELYKVGITTIGASPGNTNVIGGQMAAFKTWGKNSNKMIIKEPVGLKASVINLVKQTYKKRNELPSTKMGIFALLDNALMKAKLISNDTNKSNNEVIEADKYSILKKVLNREIPLFVRANKASEIEALLTITEKYNIKLVICGGYQADRVIESIIKAGASIIIGEQIYLSAKNYNKTDVKTIATIKDNGSLISFTLTGDSWTEGKVNYLWNAIEIYKSGVDSEDVIRMMTQYPAKLLGIEDKLGTIEEGKEADIVIYSQNPIKYYNARVNYTIIGGKIIYKGGASCVTN